MALILSRKNLKEVLTMKDTIEALEPAFADFALGRVFMPQRHAFPVDGKERLCFFMPAYIRPQHALGIKIISFFKNNPNIHALPSIMGAMILLDENTGRMEAIMDGGYITAMRTAAVSGLATKYLAREDASRLGVLGSGAQSIAHIIAISEVRPIEAVKVYSPHLKNKQDHFLKELQEFQNSTVTTKIQMVDSAKEAVQESDIVVLATSSTTPVTRANWFVKGAHINAIGSHLPTDREVDSATASRSQICCDSVEACLVEAGDIIIPIKEKKLKRKDISLALGNVVLDPTRGRTNQDEITLFKSVGLAFEDVITASLTYRRALEKAVGVSIEI